MSPRSDVAHGEGTRSAIADDAVTACQSPRSVVAHRPATGGAVSSQLDPDVAPVTIELKTSFVRPVTLATSALRADGRVVHPGSRVATAEAKLVGADGTLFAHASSTWLISDLTRKHERERVAA